MVARGNIVFIALSNTLIRFDVSDPGHPIETGRRILTPDATGDQYHRLAFSSNGSLLYVTTRRHFFILNALGGVGIPLVGQLNNLATNAAGGGSDDSVVWDMVVDGDIVYVSRAVDGLVAIDIYSPSAPRIAGSYAGPYGFNEPDGVMSMELMGNDLFITRDNRLERLSVNKTIGPWPLTNHPHGTVSFSLSCSSADNTCWPAGLSGIGLGSNLGEGKGAITQTSWGATGEAAVLSRLDPATSPVRTFDPAGYGIGNFDVDSRFTYSIGWQDTHHYEYDRSVIAEEIWNVEDPSVFVTGDLSGGVNSAGNLSSYGRYLYVADGFMPAGALDFSPRLRIFEKSTGCKPDPIAPVKLIPNRDAYKVGEQIGLAWAVGCPISATVDLLESDTPSLLKSDNYVMADDVAYGMTWTVAGPSSNYEDHVYKIRVSATYEDNSTQVFTSTPFRIEVGAKREVSLGGNKPFTSVQAAINASASGDTVVVYAGTYNEHVTLKSNVRIIGKPGASISPSTTGAAMTANGLVNTPTIDGIEFHSSGASTGAISVTGCGINVKNCTFNSLTRAVSISAGHGQFTSCTFANNQDQAGFGGAVWLDADGVQQTSFTDCRFINNSAAVRGGAVYLGSAGTYLSSMPQPNFIRCVFSGNSAPEAAAVRVGINRRPLFDHCVFASNQPGAVSGGSVVGGTAGVAGGVSATFTNCTFASNSGTQSYDVVRLEPGGTVPLPTIDATIFANNVYGNALGTSFGGTYAVSHSDFYGNSTGDATWAANGTGNFSENPAFCPAGDYSIYAFSPCAAGVKSAAVVGAREIACVPHATVTVSPGSANPNYLLVCPKGDQDMLAVQVVLDPTVMTRAPKAGELAIHAPYAPADIYSDKTITSVIDAAAPGYLMRIEHKYLSGYTWLHLPIYLNGYPLAQEALVKRRSPDLIGGDGGTNQLPIPDGKVALADFSRWTQGFPYSGHPAAYDSLCDLDANSVVNNSDFTRFVFHYKNPEHAQPFSLPALQMTFPGPVATSSAHVGMEFTEEYVTSVERHLNVDMSLEDAAGATACIFAVRTNRSDLRFLDWEKANPNILFANVTVDSVQQLYVGVAYPGPYTKATERLGQMTFDIEGSAPVDIGENEFVLTVGDIEIMGGDNQTYGAQLSGVFGRTIKGPVQQVFHNRLEQNFPNPFNPQTTIAFSIKKASNVRLAIYDVTGSRVKDLVDEKRVPGAYRVIWDGRNQSGNQVASGVYFYKLTAGDFTSAKKMVVLK
jgi:predicted outer membrane repeat protein